MNISNKVMYDLWNLAMLTSINLTMLKHYNLRNTNNDTFAIALKCFNEIKFHFML